MHPQAASFAVVAGAEFAEHSEAAGPLDFVAAVAVAAVVAAVQLCVVVVVAVVDSLCVAVAVVGSLCVVAVVAVAAEVASTAGTVPAESGASVGCAIEPVAVS